MNSKNRSVAISIVTALAIAVGVGAGCAAAKGPSDSQIQRNRIVKMLDARRYRDVVTFFSQDIHALEQPELAPLLPQAFLGLAGMEPFTISSKVLGEQQFREDLTLIIPNCGKAAIQPTAEIPPRCVLLRLLNHLPAADDPNLLQAKQLYRNIYPDPNLAPPEQNELIAMIEIASAISRLGSALMNYQSMDVLKASDAQISNLYQDIKAVAYDASQGLVRSRRSPQGVNKMLTGLERVLIFDLSWNGIHFVDGTALPAFIQAMEDEPQSLKGSLARTWIAVSLDKSIESLKE